jgi:LDH2 family malate/lactate/ureidoglycolate dehydrogenase
MSTLLAMMAEESAVRLPGSRRLAARDTARTQGIEITAALHAEILALQASAGRH